MSGKTISKKKQPLWLQKKQCSHQEVNYFSPNKFAPGTSTSRIEEKYGWQGKAS
ncbi:hypothetical protein [Clostridium paridis]|uniref:hypothetical protein n=1 Tax=Clostridium paridis TaxID=2803863 RepID=UPI00192B36B2|nr:hypothetical protein [Clostridium paridis]